MSTSNVEGVVFENPPRSGFVVTHYITVADVGRSLRYYAKVFDGRIVREGDEDGNPGIILLANTWLIINVGGGPTVDKPTVVLDVPKDADRASGFLNIRVADIRACYDLWRDRGAEFLTEPKELPAEFRCYIRDPDGYLIEVGQSK